MPRSFDTFALIDAHRRLEDLFTERPKLRARADQVEAVQTYDARAVFYLTWGGAPAVAKLIWHSHHAGAVSSQVTALKRMADILQGTTSATVPEILHFAPKAGLFVMRRLIGESGHHILEDQGRAAVPQVAEAAQHWAAAMSRSTRHEGPFPRTALLQNLTTLASDRNQQVIEKTKHLINTAPPVVTHVPGHGDYWPGNLILNGTEVGAIDLRPQKAMPLAEDLGRMACSLAVKNGDAALSAAITGPLWSLLPDAEHRHAFWVYFGLKLAAQVSNTPEDVAHPITQQFLSL